jgi:hypothetical protein
MLGWPGCCCGGPSSPPDCGRKSYAFAWGCTASVSPVASVVNLQDGGASGASEVQQLTFGPTITGGTFTLSITVSAVTNTTGAIAWSATDATLLSNITTALEALTLIGSGGVALVAGTLSGGSGTILVTFGGLRGDQDVALLVVASNSLTGASHAITVDEIFPGYASRNAVQQVYFRHVTGGTFTLTFDGETTGAITYSATPATLASNVGTALVALSNIPSGGVAVTTTGGYLVEFVGGLAATAVPTMTLDGSSLTGPATGNPPLAGITVTLKKAGVTVDEQVTDAAGLVGLALFGTASDYTVELDGAVLDDYWNNSPYSRTLTCGVNPVATWFLYTRMVLLNCSTQGGTLHVVGTGGVVDGFDETFTLLSPGPTPMMLPNCNPETVGCTGVLTFYHDTDPAFHTPHGGTLTPGVGAWTGNCGGSFGVG